MMTGVTRLSVALRRSLPTLRVSPSRHCYMSTRSAGADEADLPLAGLRVLDLSRVLAGPFCTQILGDYGASIIKVEQPGVGDETRQWRAADETQQTWKEGVQNMSLYFSSINRNKRSVTLNLKSPEGVEAVKRLAKQSDVVIHNFVTGTAERLGISYEDLKQGNEALIYASMTGYGTTGPYSRRPGYDAIAMGESGLLHITGEADGNPTKPGVAMGDMCTGLYLHGAILAALARRNRTGKGAHIEGSLFETGLSLLINVGLSGLNLDVNNGKERRRGQRLGLEHPSLTPYGAFKAKDGKLIFVAGNNNRQWSLLCEKLGLQDAAQDPRFATNDGRLENREEVKNIVGARFLEHTKNEWLDKLEGSGLPYGAINDVVEALEHPQAEAREMVMEAKDIEGAKEGSVKLIAPAVKFKGTKLGLRTNPPLLGQHTDEVLAEVGYSPEEIAKLREAKAA